MERTIYPPLPKDRLGEIFRQWQRFQDGFSVDPSIIRPLILASWERCRAASLPSDFLGLSPIDAPALERSAAQNRILVESAAHLMDKLVHSIHLSNSVVTLVDASGLVLHTSATIEDLEMVPYGVPGRRCDEKTLGTNGIGLCMIERKPVHILAAEHYNASLHYLSCSAAPIHSAAGQLIGVLNLAISTENYHQHALGLVEASANAIEEHLRLRSLIQNQKVVLELLDEGVVVLSRDGVITNINPQACKMLGMKGRPEGEKIETFIFSRQILHSILNERSCFHDREVTFELREGTLTCALSSVPLEGCGVILTLREVKRMRKYAARVAGAKAVYTFDNIVGESPALQEVLRLTRVASQSEATTLLVGESGTGKELFAQAIHNAGNRRKGPFVVVNCGALPRNLVQSELFGYVAGAFSGALKEGSPGKFELADGGTLFLDEIGEMPLEAQVSLLRLLQESEVTRLGGKQARRINVRIIAATNKNLPGAVNSKAFREDLYYRLNVLTINIPPLRRRQGDVGLLARVFLEKFSATLHKKNLRLSREALVAFENYKWPGNVRELENCVERLVNIAQGESIELDDLPTEIVMGMVNELKTKGGGPRSLKGLQKTHILETLHKTGGNLRRTSSILNISRTTLYAKIKKYSIEVEMFRGS